MYFVQYVIISLEYWYLFFSSKHPIIEVPNPSAINRWHGAYDVYYYNSITYTNHGIWNKNNEL